MINLAKDYAKRKVLELFQKSDRCKSPFQVILLILRHYDILPSPMIALEVFGMHGLWATKDYAHYCDYLELWEIDHN